MKILILTNNNPISVEELYYRLMLDFYTGDMKKRSFLSPQVEGLMIEQMPELKAPFAQVFPRVIEVCGSLIKHFADETETFFYVGSIEKRYADQFDIVIGYNDTAVSEYQITQLKLLQLKDTDTTFEDYSTLYYFLYKFLKIKE